MGSAVVKAIRSAERLRLNRDPLSRAPGAHPIAVAMGAMAGGMATTLGVAAASMSLILAAPLVAVILAVGTSLGGVVGKLAGEAVRPTVLPPGWGSADLHTRPRRGRFFWPPA